MTALNLVVVSADPERELVLVKGAVPGARGSVVVLRDSVKTPTQGREVAMTTTTAATPDHTRRHRPAPHHEEGAAGPGRAHRPAAQRRRPRPRHGGSGADGLRPHAQPGRAAPGGHRPAGRDPGRHPVDRTRAEVRGGGAKPFRQKGTGRARQGSSRSPSMSGGGVALGPKPRSYAQHTPKKMVRLALLSALSDRAEIEPHPRGRRLEDHRRRAPRTPPPSCAGSSWAPTRC